MKHLQALLALSILLTLMGCGPMDRVYGINVRNESSQEISFFVASLGWENLYPDTLLPTDELAFRRIAAGRSGNRYSDLKWDVIIGELPADTLSIFILDPVVLDSTPWEEVRDNYRILKRYDLSHEDLERLGFRVIYPPDDTMEGVRIFPPN